MKAQDIMSKDVITVPEDAKVSDAAHLMLAKRISGLPVLDRKGKIVGIATEGDFLRRSELGTQRKRPRWIEFLIGPGVLADEYSHAHSRKLGDVMTTEVQTINEDADLQDVVRIMERNRIKRVPVMRGQQIVGMITRADLLKAIGQAGPASDTLTGGDASIRERILAELKKHDWAPIAEVNVAVDAGVVRLSGILNDERQRRALMIAAENTPGVKKVEDDMLWIQPLAGAMV